MSNRLEILQQSLKKKQAKFDKAFSTHYDDVKSANGQPLNDKSNGRSTINRWERQDNALRNLKEGIKKTERAIEREENKIAGIEHVSQFIPNLIMEKVKSGELTQWKKHPHIFFVTNLKGTKIKYDIKKEKIIYEYPQNLSAEDKKLLIDLAKEIDKDF